MLDSGPKFKPRGTTPAKSGCCVGESQKFLPIFRTMSSTDAQIFCSEPKFSTFFTVKELSKWQDNPSNIGPDILVLVFSPKQSNTLYQISKQSNRDQDISLRSLSIDLMAAMESHRVHCWRFMNVCAKFQDNPSYMGSDILGWTKAVHIFK